MTTARKPARSNEYFCFEVRLLEIEPPIWRQFLLKATASFGDLHRAIQDACGWEDSHLFHFIEADGRTVIAGVPDMGEEESEPDARRVKIRKYFRTHARCLYEYDFGDSWMHDVRVIECVTLEGRFTRRLLGGARAFPKEDCGGVPGYDRCVAMLATGVDPRGEDPADLLEWIEDWRPETFELSNVRRVFDL